MKFLTSIMVTLFLFIGMYSSAMAANFNMNMGTAAGVYTFVPGSYNGPTGQGSLWATGGIMSEYDMKLQPISDADADGWNMDQFEPMSWGIDSYGDYYVSESNIDAPWIWFGQEGVHSTASAATVDLFNMHLGTIWVNMAHWHLNWAGYSNVGLGRGLDGYAGNADDWAIMSWGADGAWGGGDDTLWYQAVTPQYQVPSEPLPGGVLIAQYYELYLEGSFSSPDSPTLSGFWPASDTLVYVFGSNFVAPVGTQVSVNGLNSSAVAVVNEDMLIFMLPAGDTSGPIVVRTAQGSAISSVDFGMPSVGLTINGLWPAQGPVYDLIYVFGSGFVLAQTTVAVNGISSPAVAVVDENMLIFMVPSGATTGPITVTTPSASVTSVQDFVVMP